MIEPSRQSFVPDYVVKDILDHPGRSPVGRQRRMHVVALFADISGFTPISEALAGTGKVGAEELNGVLNSYFEPMIELVHSHGGVVAKFAGDAMTIIFPFQAANRAATTRRAVRCALDMQNNMGRYAAIPTSAGTFSLAMTAGLALGPIIRVIVGDPAIRYEHIIAGKALDLCAEAEHLAERGEVVAHNGLLQGIGDVVVEAERGGFSVVSAVGGRVARRSPMPGPGPLPEAAHETLGYFLHPTIAQRLHDNQAGFINEHRKVTILFGGFSGIDYDGDRRAGAKLQAYLLAVMRIVKRYDGFLSQVDMGDKGSKHIILFGTPIAHENDEERALRCALELRTLPQCPAHFGINTGYVYCGGIGSARRREYTAMGDAVNVAARLMQAAQPGHSVVSGFTQRYVKGKFLWRTFPPLQVKGKVEPIPIGEPLAVRDRGASHLQEPAYTLPMVGREAELRLAEAKIALVLQGQGQIIGVTADGGMGKSRLGAEIVRRAAEQGLAVHAGACHSYGTTVSYLPWRGIWQGLLGIESAAPEARVAALEIELAAIDPGLARRMPLLDIVLNIAIPNNDLTGALEAKLRKESLEDLLLAVLAHRASQAPTMLVVEDCHWIDPLSEDLLEYLGRNLLGLPVLILILYRPPEAGRGQVAGISRLPHFTELRLVDFTDAEAARLIALKLAQSFALEGEAPARLTERIQEKAQGNPFYIEEIVNFMHDRQVDPRDEAAVARMELPESLHSLIISRIDLLAEAEKSTLKVASAIGRLFRAGWIWMSYPQIGTEQQVTASLNALSDLGLTPLDKAEPELEYLFRHVVTQEVAYESMAVATRALLHERIGDFVERRYAGDLGGYTDVLAFHFGRSRNIEKQRHYFRRAGDLASNAFANQTAIDYYRRLLPLLSAAEQAEVLCSLGQIQQLIGDLEEAERSYLEALALSASDQEQGEQGEQARCQLLLGHLMWYKADSPEALNWLEQARAGFERRADRSGISQAIGRMGLVYWLQADYPRALIHFEQWARIAEELGDGASLAEAVGNIGNVFAYRGEYERALEQYERQLVLADQSANRRESLNAIGSIGLVHIHAGNYPRALERLARALEGAAEIGDRHTVMIAAVNIGVLYRLQGDHARALAAFHFVLDTAITLYERAAAAVAVGNIAWTFADQGLPERAEQLFARAITLAQALNIPYYLVDALYGRAELHARRGDYAAAQVSNNEALRIAEEAECPDIQLKAQILAIDVRVAMGLTERTRAAMEYEALLEQRAEPNERAAIYYALWRLTGADDRRRQAVELYEELAGATPNVEYRERLVELGASRLDAPVILPPLPSSMTEHATPLNTLLIQVDALIAASGSAEPSGGDE